MMQKILRARLPRIDKKDCHIIFQLIAKRYEKGSIIVTSNKPFEQWGQIFQDDIVAAAILDRLLHHCYPFFIQDPSFRMKELLGSKTKKVEPREEDP